MQFTTAPLVTAVIHETAAPPTTENDSAFEVFKVVNGSRTEAWVSGPIPGPTLDLTMAYVYLYLTAIMSVLSMLGCMALAATYYYIADLRTTGRRLLLYLSVADFLTAAGNLLGIIWYAHKDNLTPSGGQFLCEFHAALTFFSSISSFLWTVAIALHLFLCIVQGEPSLADRLVVIFHVINWGIPGVIAGVAWGLGVIGHDKSLQLPSWCWINPKTEVVSALFWQYMTGKAWEMVAYMTTVVLYACIKWKLSKQLKRSKHFIHSPSATDPGGSGGGGGGKSRKANSWLIQDANRKLTFVPAVFIAVRIWGTVRFILGAHFPVAAQGAAWIVPLQGVGDSAQGFANCILFCWMTDRVRQRFYKLFACHKCCPGLASGSHPTFRFRTLSACGGLPVNTIHPETVN